MIVFPKKYVIRGSLEISLYGKEINYLKVILVKLVKKLLKMMCLVKKWLKLFV